MTVVEFIAKWRKVQLKERSAAHEHFIDLCHVLGHPTPAAADPVGSEFCFERGAKKDDGSDGWADVWKKGFFGWEYKGKHEDLEKAYAQLQRYRESLENPPILVVCDMDRLVVRTNFTNTPTIVRDWDLDSLAEEAVLRDLRAVFFDPDKLKPQQTTQAITELAATRITDIAKALRKRKVPPDRVARFLDRIVFCMFAQDVGLLPKGLFKQLVEKAYEQPAVFSKRIGQLFQAMAAGGDFGVETIKYFNGDLFADVEVLDLKDDELLKIRSVANMNWSSIDASIFGTLFERALNPDKREQLGAHYTSREDIETVIDPVVIKPLNSEWNGIKAEVESLLATGKPQDRKKAQERIRSFTERLQQISVLDPACGSGNFLFVVLQKLKNLEKQVILFSFDHGLQPFPPGVGPWQLHGIEVNPYAHELAQMTVWIGWLQWIQSNGFGDAQEPILQKLQTFERRDAVLEPDPSGVLKEPVWPAVTFIVGNPPFLGGKKMRSALGDEYVDNLFALWKDRVPAEADFCCYWFEKARAQVDSGNCVRAGLLATQAIRGGANRTVLDRIKQTGNIFFGVSDRDWVLDGANVHVSMIGFDNGAEQDRVLDGQPVAIINPNLTSTINVTVTKRLTANAGISFMGDTKGGAFDVDEPQALDWLQAPNPNGRPNSDVLRPWVNGRDVSQRSREMWIVDFSLESTVEEAARYEGPYAFVKERIYPIRRHNRRIAYANRWWGHVEPRPEMRSALQPLSRYVATLTVSKHRLFAWLPAPTLPDHQLIVFGRDDDYFFGLLQSRVHEVWARQKGTQLREVESGFRYTPTSTFETFPTPEPTGEQRDRIAKAAGQLERERMNWLNPALLVREQTLTFPASVDGIWTRFIKGPVKDGVGTAYFTRLVAADATSKLSLRKRTLTALYTSNPDWLKNLHARLDAAVLDAYGFPFDISDSAVVVQLLEMNQSSQSEAAAEQGDDPATTEECGE